MRTPEENKATAREFVQRVMNEHDMDYLDSMLADDMVENNPLDPSMGNDRKAVLATFEVMFAASPDARAEVLDMVASGDRVAIRSRYSGIDNGTGWGAMMGAPATGKSFAIEGIDVAVIGEDGKMKEHYGVFDVMGMMGQLGLLPAPGDDHEH